MPEFFRLTVRGSQSQSRIFFTLCFLFSLVVVSLIVFYLIMDASVSSNGVYNFEQHSRRPSILRSELLGKVGESFYEDQTLMMVDNKLEDHHGKTSVSNKEEGLDGLPKIRHHNHHHGKPALTLEELEQRSLLSNVIETRMLHLDLKGAQPRVSYLKEVRHSKQRNY